ncbi:hypothetical protein HanLR1_Chr08g0279691 [Helianthus annuus]|nr:hypothetical protein HanLR1_Chr08g0279691 [Helianthus annuus]
MIIFISIILIHILILILTGAGYFIFSVKKEEKKKIWVMVFIVQIETIILYSKEASRQLLYSNVVAVYNLYITLGFRFREDDVWVKSAYK